jgi:hypothetical protein
MNNLESKESDTARKNQADAPKRSRAWLQMVVVFLAGAVVSGAWFTRGTWYHPAAKDNAPALSAATESFLQQLKTPVEIRFYSLLDNTGGDSLRTFSGRVDQLLARYEQVSGGKLIVSRSQASSDSSADAALADGVKPFNLDKGSGCYLGLAVVCAQQKETLPRLSPEWEQALEPDLTRAIERAVWATGPGRVERRADPAALESVKNLIPNIDSVSSEQGERAIRRASLGEFQQAVKAMQAKVKAAEDRFLQAQAQGSESGQEAARKELQQIQAEHLAKLRQLTDSSQAQVNAFQQIKATSH